jgi:hypothetical protein
MEAAALETLQTDRCNRTHSAVNHTYPQDTLVNFWEKTSKTMSHVNNGFKGYQYYEFSYIKVNWKPPLKQLTIMAGPGWSWQGAVGGGEEWEEK